MTLLYVGYPLSDHRRNKMNLSACLISVLIYFVHPISADVELDREHLDIYPFCGKLFGYEWHDATSRVVNSKESDTQYPWVVFLKHSFLTKGDGSRIFIITKSCSGTVIGEKQVDFIKKYYDFSTINN